MAKGLHLVLEQSYFQKRGQQLVDPDSGKPRMQDYQSATRFEMYDAALPLRKTSVN
jgi:hypothetical protein